MLSEERHVVEPVSNPEVVPPPHGDDHVKEKSVYKGGMFKRLLTFRIFNFIHYHSCDPIWL